MEVAFVCFPYSVADILEAGEAADAAERALLFGVADSPRLFAESYVSQQHVLAHTHHVCVGPFATNPVTRHWSVHAGSQRSLEELHPGRLFFGLAAGDSAVHAFSLPPASAAAVVEHAERVLEFGPPGTRLIIAGGGPRACARAGHITDEVVVGQGSDAGATKTILDTVDEARRSAGITSPLRSWLYVLADVWEDEGPRDPAKRDAFRSMIMAYSRQAMSVSYAGKNVPEELQPGLTELYSQFSFEDYVGSSHNSELLAAHAEEEAFVTARFGVIGPPESIAEQLRAMAAETGVDRIWLGLLTQDAAAQIRLLVERALPHLVNVEAGTQ